LNLCFKVERQSETGSFEDIRRPCDGAWAGAYLDELGHAQIGWFITLDEAPAKVEGHPVRSRPVKWLNFTIVILGSRRSPRAVR
jgi:hypothetical protein